MHNQYCSALHLHSSGQFETLPKSGLWITVPSYQPLLHCVYPDRRNCILLPILPSRAEQIKKIKCYLGRRLNSMAPANLHSGSAQTSKQWLKHSEGWINKFSQSGYTRIKTGGNILSPLIPHSVSLFIVTFHTASQEICFFADDLVVGESK